MNSSCTLCVVLFLAATSISAEESVDLDMVNKIRDEGFSRSEVMESLRILADENPDSMVAAEPELEDVYFGTLIEHNLEDNLE